MVGALKKMPIRWDPRNQANLFIYIAKWFIILLPVAALIGSACAFFLISLNKAVDCHWQNPWLLYLLPVAGIVIGWTYHKLGRASEGGNNLIVEQIHEPGGGVPASMAPLILGGTLLTHLFGGSAGREGTAVQMGGSIASAFGRVFSISRDDTRVLLMAGVAAGFGAVFGTPVTGAVFAMEVVALGAMRYEALMPCLIASIVGDWSCSAWGVSHTAYTVKLSEVPHLNLMLALKVAVAAVVFGLASLLFAETAHGLHYLFKKAIPSPVFRPFVGGCLVIALVFLVDSRDYLMLGVTAQPDNLPHVSILSSFQPNGAHTWSWLWKLIFTCVTISSGFKGGEVTPLFFIGAALGNTMAVVLGAPTDLFAALGFIAVFAGAANTPLACTIMGIELFKSEYAVYFALACFLSYLFSGHSGIYLSQRIGSPKYATLIESGASLRSAREQLPSVPGTVMRRVKAWFSK